jgi:hypothetical protein
MSTELLQSTFCNIQTFRKLTKSRMGVLDPILEMVYIQMQQLMEEAGVDKATIEALKEL